MGKIQSGIYIITNIYTKRFYIGSAVNLVKRYNNHKSDLRKNRHPNKKLQNGYNKYGEGCFEYKVLEYCPVNKLIINEQQYIDQLKPWYNIKQKPNSETTKLRKSKYAKNRSETHKLNIKKGCK